MVQLGSHWMTVRDLQDVFHLSRTAIHNLDDELQPIRRSNRRRYDPRIVEQVLAKRTGGTR